MTAKKLPKPHIFDKIDPLIAVALSGLKNNEAQREKVKAGHYQLTATVKITTKLSVGFDHDAQQVNKLEPWTLIALLLDKLPGTKIDEVVAEAEALRQIKEKEDGLEERAKLAEERAQHVLDTVKAKAVDAVEAVKDSTKQMRKGAVKLEESVVTVVDYETVSID